MTLIVHLSDTHFGTEIPVVVDALRNIIGARKPDLIIVSGDITQRARRAEFDAAKRFFQSLPPPLLVIPGNHDIPLFDLLARGLFPYRNYCAALGRQSGTWFGGDVAVFGFNSTSPLRHTRGKLSPAHFKATLKESPPESPRNCIRIACVHQPLHTAWMQDAHNRLIDVETTAEQFSRHDFDLVLSGHVHVPYIATTRESFPALNRHFILSGAGTATSYRTRPGAPNSFNFIETGSNGEDAEVDITLCRFDEEKSEFLENPPYRFRRVQDGWKEVPPDISLVAAQDG
jgi:3',5'-cyclic AMP phosphodiesterase CpdA